ncbi:MAG: tetratricopeptide repeat protein [Opitutales bacterium]
MISSRNHGGWRRAALVGGVVWSMALAREQSTPPVDPPPLATGQTGAIQPAGVEAEPGNGPLTRARQALQEKKWAEAEQMFRQLLAATPGRWDLQQGLGDALLNQGRFLEAVGVYEDGLAAVQPELARDGPAESVRELKSNVARLYTCLGNANLKLRRTDAALASYRKSVELFPTPTACFNLAAVCYNLGKMDETIVYADQAIAAGTKNADVYFLKGSALFSNGTLDKSNRYLLPAGTVECLRKYQELAPAGGHAADVKAMLEAAGEPVPNTSQGRDTRPR